MSGPSLTLMSMSFFFFQAEDGIRDLTVTGVQTCALPISRRPDLRGYELDDLRIPIARVIPGIFLDRMAEAEVEPAVIDADDDVGLVPDGEREQSIE